MSTKPQKLGFFASKQKPFIQTFNNETKRYVSNPNFMKPKLAFDEENKRYVVDPETGLNVETNDIDTTALVYDKTTDDYEEVQKYAYGMSISEIIKKYTDNNGQVYLEKVNEDIAQRAKPTIQEATGNNFVDISKFKDNLAQNIDDINKLRAKLEVMYNDYIQNNQSSTENVSGLSTPTQTTQTTGQVIQEVEQKEKKE